MGGRPIKSKQESLTRQELAARRIATLVLRYFRQIDLSRITTQAEEAILIDSVQSIIDNVVENDLFILDGLSDHLAAEGVRSNMTIRRTPSACPISSQERLCDWIESAIGRWRSQNACPELTPPYKGRR